MQPTRGGPIRAVDDLDAGLDERGRPEDRPRSSDERPLRPEDQLDDAEGPHQEDPGTDQQIDPGVDPRHTGWWLVEPGAYRRDRRHHRGGVHPEAQTVPVGREPQRLDQQHRDQHERADADQQGLDRPAEGQGHGERTRREGDQLGDVPDREQHRHHGDGCPDPAPRPGRPGRARRPPGKDHQERMQPQHHHPADPHLHDEGPQAEQGAERSAETDRRTDPGSYQGEQHPITPDTRPARQAAHRSTTRAITVTPRPPSAMTVPLADRRPGDPATRRLLLHDTRLLVAVITEGSAEAFGATRGPLGGTDAVAVHRPSSPTVGARGPRRRACGGELAAVSLRR